MRTAVRQIVADDETGEVESAAILGQFGEVPEDHAEQVSGGRPSSSAGTCRGRMVGSRREEARRRVTGAGLNAWPPHVLTATVLHILDDDLRYDLAAIGQNDLGGLQSDRQIDLHPCSNVEFNQQRRPKFHRAGRVVVGGMIFNLIEIASKALR